MQPLLTTLYRRQADRPNLGTNANQIPTTIYIKTDRESNLISNQCSNCHKIFASDTNIKMHNYTLKKSTHYQGESNIFPNFSFCLFPLLHFVAECQFNCGDKEAGFAPAEKKRNPPSSTAIHFGEKIEISASASEMMMMIRKMICSRHLAGSLQRREDHDANCAESCNHFAHKLPQGCKKSTMLQNFAKKYAAGQK